MATRVIGLTLLLLALMLQAAPAQQDLALKPGDHGAVPQVWMSIRGISPNGPFGYEAKLSWNLDPGHTALLRVQAGSSEVPNVCAVGTLAKDFDSGALAGWLLEARVLELKATSARLSLRWSRNVLVPGAIVGGDMRREYELTFSEGASSVIDLVRPPDGGSPGCDGVVIEMGFDFADPPARASEVLDYDIWLVHHEADGRQVVDRTAGRGLQGEIVRYRFKPLRDNDAGAPIDAERSMEFGGWMRGRLRPDGRITVSVWAQRVVWKNRLGQSHEGSLTTVVGDGETLEVEIPPHESGGLGQSPPRTSVRVTIRRIR